MRLYVLYLMTSILPLTVLGSHEDQMVMPELSNFSPTKHTKPSLHDLLTIETSLSIFFSYARETEASNLFLDKQARSTLLVPTNKAVMDLARKPHQGPAPVQDDVGITENQSKKNVEEWVTAHIIPQSPIPLSSRSYPTLLLGKSISFTPVGSDTEKPEWNRVLLDDKIRIIGMKEASNGVLYIIDGTISVS